MSTPTPTNRNVFGSSGPLAPESDGSSQQRHRGSSSSSSHSSRAAVAPDVAGLIATMDITQLLAAVQNRPEIVAALASAAGDAPAAVPSSQHNSPQREQQEPQLQQSDSTAAALPTAPAASSFRGIRGAGAASLLATPQQQLLRKPAAAATAPAAASSGAIGGFSVNFSLEHVTDDRTIKHSGKCKSCNSVVAPKDAYCGKDGAFPQGVDETFYPTSGTVRAFLAQDMRGWFNNKGHHPDGVPLEDDMTAMDKLAVMRRGLAYCPHTAILLGNNSLVPPSTATHESTKKHRVMKA